MLDSGQFGLRGKGMQTTSIPDQGAQIVSVLENTFRNYVALDTGLPLVLALWALATHVFDCFDAFPYLQITSPTKRCGKTRVAEILELLSCGGLRTANASSAAIFRMIQSRTVEGQTLTLIMDEMEVLGTNSERAEQLREILNAGYRRGQVVLRCESVSSDEGKYEVKSFNTYCPKVLVLIGRLNDTLADRCIPIAMRRRKPAELLERFFYAEAAQHAKRLCREMQKWAKTNHLRVRRRLRKDLEFLEDREAELWIPLFAVCQVAAPERVEELKAIALQISGAKQADEPAEFSVLLLSDIRDIFNRNAADRIFTAGLVQALLAIGESPWENWAKGRDLNDRGIAKLLRPFKIKSQNLRVDDQVSKGYKREDFEEAWSIYLSRDSSATPLQAAPEQANHDASDPLQESRVADEKVPEHLQ
jgi:hypothetical protein